jgi:hypothetical protein
LRNQGAKGRLAVSDVEHRVVELATDAAGDGGLEAELRRHENEGWELAATLPRANGNVSLIFKRPRPLFDS